MYLVKGIYIILFLLKNCIHDFKYALLAPKFNVIRTSYIYTQTEKRSQTNNDNYND